MDAGCGCGTAQCCALPLAVESSLGMLVCYGAVHYPFLCSPTPSRQLQSAPHSLSHCLASRCVPACGCWNPPCKGGAFWGLWCMDHLRYPQFMLSLEGLKLLGPCLDEVPVLTVLIPLLICITACRPGSTSSFLNFSSLNQSQAGPRPGSAGAAGSSALSAGEASRNVSHQRSFCLQNQPVVREDLDVVSVRYRLLNGPTVPVNSLSPTLVLLNLNTGMDSGGTLVVSLLLNKVRRLMDEVVSPLQGFVPAPGLVCQQTPGVVGTSETTSLFFLLSQNTLSLF